jgi:hypothetical protein
MEDESLNNTVIAAIIAGIIIVSIALYAMEPKQRYYTDMYFSDHDYDAKFIDANKQYELSFAIANYEKEEANYTITATAELFNKTINIKTFRVTLPQEKTAEIAANYTLPDFYKAKIVISIPNKSQEIHFYAYNKNYFREGALLDCVKESPIIPVKNFTIRAHGDRNPNMSVFVDGALVYSSIVNATKNFFINKSLSVNTLDIVFNNDFYNGTSDTNLYVDFVKIGNVTLIPENATYDRAPYVGGVEVTAFDCEDIRKANGNMSWNGALRYIVEGIK